jgi:geranylgeranyl diphosphate synthase type I
VSGEALDVHLSLRPLENVAVEEVERMMSLKTGALLEFCANAGAAIALDSAETADSDPRAMETAAFAREAGIAFQLLDDWLGVFGDESTFGKPICSDLAESKPTVMLLDAVSALDGDDRTNLLSLLGRELDSAETARARTLFEKSGAPERTRREAEKLAESAKKRLDTFPDGKHKSLLIAWTNLLVNRKS